MSDLRGLCGLTSASFKKMRGNQVVKRSEREIPFVGNFFPECDGSRDFCKNNYFVLVFRMHMPCGCLNFNSVSSGCLNQSILLFR